MTKRPKPVVLTVLDGWGYRAETKVDRFGGADGRNDVIGRERATRFQRAPSHLDAHCAIAGRHFIHVCRHRGAAGDRGHRPIQFREGKQIQARQRGPEPNHVRISTGPDDLQNQVADFHIDRPQRRPRHRRLRRR